MKELFSKGRWLFLVSLLSAIVTAILMKSVDEVWIAIPVMWFMCISFVSLARAFYVSIENDNL